MKIIIASDLHGSAKWCAELLSAYDRENAELLLLCGDILYHGPRNPLPDDYSPMKVVELLTRIKDKIICVCGNCDSEVDRMVLPFEMYCKHLPYETGRRGSPSVCVNSVFIHLDHGHYPAPYLPEGAVYITGHTHVPLNVKENGYYHLNPGSVSLPKENSPHSYILFTQSYPDGGVFEFKDFDGNVFDKLVLDVKA